MSRIAVVGAGLCGLAAAAALAEDGHAVTVVDRLPAIGGLAGWEDPTARSLDDEGRRRGVLQRLGATALRWTPPAPGTPGDAAGALLVAAPGDIGRLEADHLVIAGGTRPATPAELRLAGDRPAGVVAASLAEHLVGARVTFGRAPLIYGVSHWSSLVAHRLHERGARIRVLGQPGAARPAWADEWLGTGVLCSVGGRPRLESVTWAPASGGEPTTVPADALILAAPARPLRNVEGAVFDGTAVTFIAETDLAVTPVELVSRARAAALAIPLPHHRRSSP